MKKKLPGIGLGKWVLITAFIAGFNLLAAGAQASPTKLNSILPAVAGNVGTGTMLSWFTGTTSLPTLLGMGQPALGKKEDPKDKDKNKDDESTQNGTPVATVPDGGNSLLLLGAAFLGVAIAARRLKGSAPQTR